MSFFSFGNLKYNIRLRNYANINNTVAYYSTCVRPHHRICYNSVLCTDINECAKGNRRESKRHPPVQDDIMIQRVISIDSTALMFRLQETKNRVSIACTFALAQNGE